MSDTGRQIHKVFARQILDSRGRPTVEADVILKNGMVGRASTPSGASTGRYEAVELRDADRSAYGGRGVTKAVAHINTVIAKALVGTDVRAQAHLDSLLIELDGTPNFARLGANAALATSLAACRAAASYVGLPLYRYINELTPGRQMTMPVPMTNILSGGAHAGRGMDLQDFLAMPLRARTYSEALDMISTVRNVATGELAKKGLTTLLADEGGLSPGFADSRDALDIMVQSFVDAGLSPGHDMAITVDVAASELFKNGKYQLERKGVKLSGREMISMLGELLHDYPIASIEDPLDQDDWESWAEMTAKFGQIQILGDDLFVTNRDRIERGITSHVANAVLIKLNQNGTLTGTLAAMATAWSAGYATIVSARSGETDDSFIADLAVGTGAGQIKIGSVRNAERLAKYNQLLRIEETEDFVFGSPDGVACVLGSSKSTRLSGRGQSPSLIT